MALLSINRCAMLPQCCRIAKARNIIKGYVVEGSTFWLQIENSGFNSSISLVALQAKLVLALYLKYFSGFFLILISSMVEQDTSNILIQVRVLDKSNHKALYIHIYSVLGPLPFALAINHRHIFIKMFFNC